MATADKRPSGRHRPKHGAGIHRGARPHHGAAAIETPSIPIPDDRVARARDGDEEALRELLRAVHPLVLRWARSWIADDGEAEDLAQDVLVAVVRGLADFDGRSRLSSWLYRITRNAALDRIEGEKRRKARMERWSEERGTAVVDDPVRRLRTERAIGVAERAFRELPPRQREVFDLSELQGVPASEVAERLGVAPSTVRVTLMKARRALRGAVLATDPDLDREVGR